MIPGCVSDTCLIIFVYKSRKFFSVFQFQGNGQILSTRAAGLSLQPYEEYSNAVRFVAENFIEFNTKKAIDREKLMTVLVNMTHLLIRANYNIAKKAVYR